MTEAEFDEIAPELLEMGEQVRAAGGSYVCLVEWDGGGSCTTACLSETAGPAARMARYAARAGGNADLLIQLLLKDAERHGYNSVFLKILESSLGKAP